MNKYSVPSHVVDGGATIEEMFEELEEEWGSVHLRYNTNSHFESVVVSDSTDEGLGGEGYNAGGESVREALENAVENPTQKRWDDE